MATKWKIIIPVGVVAIIAVIVVVLQLGGGTQKATKIVSTKKVAEESSVAPLVAPPAATDNVDNVINALFTDSSSEITQIGKEMNDDAALVSFDSQAISDFGQSYNESDF